jgi:transcriptional regulator GlxA family with amidase domain
LLGRSIHEEIMASRVRKAKNLLIETELSIAQITEMCGFCNRAHLSEVFKEQTGHSPASFRRDFRVYR